MLKLQNKFKNIKNKKKLFLSQIIILSFFNIYFLYIFI